MSAKNKLTRREDIPATAKWHLSDIYATRDAWQTARDSIAELLKAITAYRAGWPTRRHFLTASRV